MSDPAPNLQLLGHAERGFDVGPANIVAVTIDLAPGSPGAPPHRHPGPVFGYVVEGEILFELEGEPERILRAGDAFWEPGGDVIHYQAANNRSDAPARFSATLICPPGQEILTFVSAEELADRADLRHPRPT
jgi:quercetin dioxygenase-like cupin family protein